MKPFLLFLDIDGVLNSNEWFTKLVEKKPHAKKPKLNRKDFRTDRFFPLYRYNRLDTDAIYQASRLYGLVEGAKWVVSSTWRKGSDDEFADLILYLARCGLKGEIIGRTATHPSASRGSQIQVYLDKCQIEAKRCVILDDERDMLHLSHRHIKTDYNVGLTRADVDRAKDLIRST